MVILRFDVGSDEISDRPSLYSIAYCDIGQNLLQYNLGESASLVSGEHLIETALSWK